MRDLVRHPITVKEIETALDQLADEIDADNAAKGACGDMRPLLLRAGAAIAMRAKFATFDLNRAAMRAPKRKKA